MALFGLIGGILGGLAQRSAARKAADAQTRAAREQIAYEKETRDLIRGDLSPYRNVGPNALGIYNYEMFGGTKPEGYGGYMLSPEATYNMQQGEGAVNALAGARGGLLSGRTLEALTKLRQGIASQDRGNYLSRIGGLIDTGLSAAQMSGQASQNATAGISSALGNIGNARAAGAIGQGNAFSGMLDNVAGAWQYQKAMQPSNTSGIGWGGWKFGGGT